MAFSQKLSLRAYSFSFKKWKGKNPEQILPLNAKVIFNRLQDGEERIYEYTSALDLIVDFIGANTDVDDKEVRQQLFNCSFDSTNQGETDTYRYLIFTVYAGYYGYASKLVNRKTKSTVHKKSRDEADVKPFYVVVVIPKDTEISKAQRGLILFQEIGIYGVKTVTTKAMQEFFSKKLGLTFRTQNLAPDFYLKKLFESGMIQKIKLARNVQSNDTADKLYGAGYGREERTLVPIKITNQMKAKLRHVSEAKYNYFTFDNHDYPETKMVVKIGDRLRTIDLHGLDELSVEEALPDELLLPDGTIDFPNFETHKLRLGVDSNAKSLNEILLARMLDVKGRIACTEEFQKAGIIPKTIRVQSNKCSLPQTQDSLRVSSSSQSAISHSATAVSQSLD